MDLQVNEDRKHYATHLGRLPVDRRALAYDASTDVMIEESYFHIIPGAVSYSLTLPVFQSKNRLYKIYSQLPAAQLLTFVVPAGINVNGKGDGVNIVYTAPVDASRQVFDLFVGESGLCYLSVSEAGADLV